MDISLIKKDLNQKMEKSIVFMQSEFSGLRTGRASSSLIKNIRVNLYGSEMPIDQVGTISVPDSQMLSVSVWDKSAIGPTEKAIRESGLGLNPSSDGNLIRIPIPSLTEERRKSLVKIANELAENGKIAIRNARREGMDKLKVLEKNKEISEDELKEFSEEIQKITDKYIGEIDNHLKNKTTDIMTV